MLIGKKILTFFGYVLIVLGVLAFYNAISHDPMEVLWFSYAALLLVGLGVVTRNSYLIGSQVNIILIPYIIWNLDFFYYLITGSELFGVTNYFFNSRPTLAQIITLQHIFLVPIALYALSDIKIKRKDFWMLSLAQVILFFIIIKVIGDEKNVNCISYNCLPFEIALYPAFWIIAYCLMIFITTKFLISIKAFKK